MKSRQGHCEHGHKLEMRPRPDLGEGWAEGWASASCKRCPKDKPVAIACKECGPPTRTVGEQAKAKAQEEAEPEPNTGADL